MAQLSAGKQTLYGIAIAILKSVASTQFVHVFLAIRGTPPPGLLSGGERDNRGITAGFRHQPCQWAGAEIFPLLHLF